MADGDGVAFLDRATGDELWAFPLEGGAHGLASITGIDDEKYYATAGTADKPTYAVVDLGQDAEDKGPSIANTYPLPGLGSRIGYDEPTRQVHILGRTPDGSGSTVYVVEPHANAVYADARLPFDPSAWAFDIDEGRPGGDRQQLLAFGADGSGATVEIGQHAFSWRMPGVIAGALMAGLLYVLARILFRRREVALLAGLFALVDGMLFAQSRIAMNDAFVGLFIIAAYTLFAAIWTDFWKSRWAFWLAMPVIGLLLGLALASKWVAAYAIGALILLILVRSALGRVLAIGGLIAITAVLGYIAISVPEGSASPFGNVTFLLIMIGLTLVAVLASVLHPVAWSDEEFRLAVLGPAGLGTLVFFGGPRDGTAVDRVRARPDPRASAGPRDRPRPRLTRRVRPVLARAAVRLRAVGRAAGTGRPGALPRTAGVSRPPAGCARAGCSESRSCGPARASSCCRWSSTSSRTCRGPRSTATRSCRAGRPGTPARPCSS